MLINSNIIAAYNFVVAAHINQKDKGSGVPYHWHLARVAIRMGEGATEEDIITALCHDVLEDTLVTRQELAAQSWMTTKILDAISLCSNIYYKDKTHKEWMAIIAQSQSVSAKKVKLSDCSDNKSIERLKGLEIALRAQAVLERKDATPPKKTLAEMVLKRATKKINKQGCYGLWKRYIQDIGIILEHNPHFSQEINLGNFGSLEELENLKGLLGSEEFNCYVVKQNVDFFKEKAVLYKPVDNAQQPYLALEISPKVGELYKNGFLSLGQVKDTQLKVANQVKRDKGQHHITVLSAAEYARILKENDAVKIKILNSHIAQCVDIYLGPIGSIDNQKTADVTYYALAYSGWIDTLRHQLGFEKKDLHLTIGFDKKDVFTKPKNLQTKICNFSDIAQFIKPSVASQNFSNTSKIKIN